MRPRMTAARRRSERRMWNKLTRAGRKALRAMDGTTSGAHRDLESSKAIRRERNAA